MSNNVFPPKVTPLNVYHQCVKWITTYALGQAKLNPMQNVEEKVFETMWIDKMIKQTKNCAF
jgi:hypothetical protein